MSIDYVASWPSRFGFREKKVVASDGTRLRVVEGGPADARRVILLHGAPQFSYTWRHVMARLASQYRVIAPDLRGYGASSLALSGGYGIDQLTSDLDTVERSTARGDDDSFLLVAHDWGGPIAWSYAEQFPDKVRHLIAVNAPHAGAFASELTTPRQAIRSWYIGLFQLPGLEHAIAKTRASFFLWMMWGSSPRGTFSKDDLELYRASLTRPGRIQAVLAYYREAFGTRSPSELNARRHEQMDRPGVLVPTTIVWGDADPALSPTHPEACRRYAAQLEIRRLSGVSHWVPEERPAEVIQAVLDGDAR